MTHCIGVNAMSAIANFEKMVSGLGVPVKIEKTEDHVPSFLEKWVWFQVTRVEGDIKEVNGENETSETSEADKEPAKEEIKDEQKAEAKEDAPKAEAKKEALKAEEKKGAKDVKEKLESPKEKGLNKEKSNVDKKY